MSKGPSTTTSQDSNTRDWLQTELNRVPMFQIVRPQPENRFASILLLAGYRANGGCFRKEAETFATMLQIDVDILTYAECKSANEARDALESFFDGNASEKSVIYVGHGMGGSGSFCFDIGGDNVNFKVNDNSPEMIDKGKERYLFMHEFISIAAAPQKTRRVYFFNCACYALASSDVIRNWAYGSTFNNNVTQFFVRSNGCEIKELIAMNKEPGTNTYAEKTIVQGVREVLQMFQSFIVNSKYTFPWPAIEHINCSYSTPPAVRQSFKSEDDDLLKKDPREEYWDDEVVGNAMKFVEWNDRAIIWQTKERDNSSNQLELHGHEKFISDPKTCKDYVAGKDNRQLTDLHVKHSRKDATKPWTPQLSDYNKDVLNHLCAVFEASNTNCKLHWKPNDNNNKKK